MRAQRLLMAQAIKAMMMLATLTRYALSMATVIQNNILTNGLCNKALTIARHNGKALNSLMCTALTNITKNAWPACLFTPLISLKLKATLSYSKAI